MKMMRIRGVWTTNAAAFLIGFGMYSSFVLIPQFVEMPARAGYGFGVASPKPGSSSSRRRSLMLLAGPLAGRLSNRVGSRVPLVLGTLATGPAFVLLAVAHAHPWEIYVGPRLLGLGIGLAFASLANLIVEAVRPDQTGVATGMNTSCARRRRGRRPDRREHPRRPRRRRRRPDGGRLHDAVRAGRGACVLATLASFAVPRPVLAPVPVPAGA